MIRVCALSNSVGAEDRHLGPYLSLEKSLREKNVPFYFFMEGIDWRWKRKIEWELELTSRYPDDHFVFIDSWDYLFIGEKRELEEIVTRVPLLFSVDGGDAPWPEPHLAKVYDKRREKLSPWCWINGSGPAGKGSEIAKAIKWGLSNVQFREPPETDQTFWTKVYLYGGFGELDQYCYLTQPLYDSSREDKITPHLMVKDGRLINTVTLARPQFIHATGHSWSVIPKELIP